MLSKFKFYQRKNKQIIGYFDGLSGQRIHGWACTDKFESVTIELYLDKEKIISSEAFDYRYDLIKEGIGDGCHGFEIAIPNKYVDGNIYQVSIIAAKGKIKKKLAEFDFSETSKVDISYEEDKDIDFIDKNEIYVSIVCMTYNHKDYVRDALNGFLKQETNFKFEVIVGDDASTDGTQDVIKEYQKRYPEIIKFVEREKNIGARKNINDLFMRANGKYIALNEGDDYWTDPLKLQKQVAYLERNKQCAVCFHPVKVIDQDDPKKIDVFPRAPYKFVYSLEDLINRNIIQTNSVMYRWDNKIKKYLIDVFDDLLMPGDWFRHIVVATFGEIHMVPDVMSVYRRNNGGMWGKISHKERRKRYGIGELQFFKKVDLLTNHKYSEINQRRISLVYNDIFFELFKEMDVNGIFELINYDKQLADKFFRENSLNINANSIHNPSDVEDLLRKILRISVVVTSYKHERYIKEVFESILRQKGLFNLEIVYADDFSQDGSMKIVKEIIKGNENIVKILPSKKNLGMLNNLRRAFSACTGSYVAICEGDDYWLSSNKLHRQLSFMLENPHLTMCFNWVLLEYVDKGYSIPHPGQGSIPSKELGFADLLKTPLTSNFSCCFYKKKTIDDIPDRYFQEQGAADWLFNVCAADQGNVGFVRDILSVYRVHSSGQWSGLTEMRQKERMKLAYKTFSQFFPTRLDQISPYITDVKGSGVIDIGEYQYINLDNIDDVILNIDKIEISECYVELSGWIVHRRKSNDVNDNKIVYLTDKNGNVKVSIAAKNIFRDDVNKYIKASVGKSNNQNYLWSGFSAICPFPRDIGEFYIVVGSNSPNGIYYNKSKSTYSPKKLA